MNNFIDGRGACYLAYAQPTDVLCLVGDAGGGLTGKPLTGSGMLSNSQCSVDLARTSVAGSGNTLTLSLHITFTSAFGGDRVLYSAARDRVEANSGWQPMGVVRVPLAPSTPHVETVLPG